MRRVGSVPKTKGSEDAAEVAEEVVASDDGEEKELGEVPEIGAPEEDELVSTIGRTSR